ncbi:unnamed protein product [Ilex paraguariensis]|uniref:Uncharacterized protein n=1 Tax=Ilex paraguariensis TaxID=185542 RepID=A0ABC8TBU1_9AQUA
MEIPEKLLKFKFHILFASVFSLLIISIIYVAPRFLEILAYFWPLLVSTALFLITVIVFGQISPPTTEASGEKTGEVILDYVAGQPEQVQPEVESYKSDE